MNDLGFGSCPLVCYDQPFYFLWRVHLIYTIRHFDNIYVKYMYVIFFLFFFVFSWKKDINFICIGNNTFIMEGQNIQSKKKHTHTKKKKNIYIYISNIYIFCRGFICHWQYVHGQDKASIMRDFFF